MRPTRRTVRTATKVTPRTDGAPSPGLSVPAPSLARVSDRYGSDVLATDWRAPKRGRAVEAPAELGAVVEEVTTDWCGEIVAVDRDLDTLTLEDRRGKRRTFPLGPGGPRGGGPPPPPTPTPPPPAPPRAGPFRWGRGSCWRADR